MEKQDLIRFYGQFVCIGLPAYSKSRSTPYFFYGKIEEINEENILLKLNKNSGLKLIKINEIVDIHLDPKYKDLNRRISGN